MHKTPPFLRNIHQDFDKFLTFPHWKKNYQYFVLKLYSDSKARCHQHALLLLLIMMQNIYKHAIKLKDLVDQGLCHHISFEELYQLDYIQYVSEFNCICYIPTSKEFFPKIHIKGLMTNSHITKEKMHSISPESFINNF